MMRIDSSSSSTDSFSYDDLYKVIDRIAHLQLLIVIQDIDHPLKNDESHLKEVLKIILNRCNTEVKLLMTSQISLGKIGSTNEYTHDLNELTDEQSATLFFEQAKTVNDSGKVCGYTLQQLIDLKHPLFRTLNNHPFSISMIARTSKNKSLDELDAHIKSEEFKQTVTNEAHCLSKFGKALDSSVKYIYGKNKDTLDFWFLVGKLPGGLTKIDLSKIWCKNDFQCHIMDLQNQHLIRETKHNGSDQQVYNIQPCMENYLKIQMIKY